MRRSWQRSTLIALPVLLAISLSLSGCAVFDRLSDALYPTATPGGPGETQPTAKPTSAEGVSTTVPPTLAPTLTVPAPTQTPMPIPTQEPTVAPTPQSGQHLVYSQGSSIFKGDYLGREPIEVALVPQLESWDFDQGKLAIARNQYLQIVDLVIGKLSNYKVALDRPIEFSDVHWSTEGSHLLFSAIVEDAEAQNLGRSVILRAISPIDGATVGQALVQDVTSLIVGAYHAQDNQVSYIPLTGGPGLNKVETLDLGSGQVVSSMAISGEGEASFSQDGRYLLVEQLEIETTHNGLALYDLSAPEVSPHTLLHPADTHSVSHIWSSDGRQIAFMLRDGLTYDSAQQGMGVWVLDVDTMEAVQVLNEPDPTSWLVGWSPDNQYIVGYHHSAEQSYFYAIHPDGGDLRILPMEGTAEILGWMPVTKGTVDKVVMDPWRIRLLDAEGDEAAMAEVVAQFVAANVQTDDQELTSQLRAYLQDVEWPLGSSKPNIKRVGDGVFVAQLPAFTIYLLSSGQAQPILYGDVLLDARLDGNDLGIIFGTFSVDALQPAFALLVHQDDGTWTTGWMAQGQRDWITTNGEIRFTGDGLDELAVTGTSFGLDYDDNVVFDECRSCVHRVLSGMWQRDGEVYARQTALADEAAVTDVYWEMTDRTAYAILYETLRRIRLDLDTAGLAAPEVVKQVIELGLNEKGLLLSVKNESDNRVQFCVDEICYEAVIEGEQVVAVEVIP